MKNICTVQVDLFYSFVISNGVMKAKINISLKGWKLLFLKMTEDCHFAFANNEWSLMCMVVVPYLFSEVKMEVVIILSSYFVIKSCFWKT